MTRAGRSGPGPVASGGAGVNTGGAVSRLLLGYGVSPEPGGPRFAVGSPLPTDWHPIAGGARVAYLEDADGFEVELLAPGG